MSDTTASERTALDVLVAGAGYVGLATAVSLKQARPGLAVAVVARLMPGDEPKRMGIGQERFLVLLQISLSQMKNFGADLGPLRPRGIGRGKGVKGSLIPLDQASHLVQRGITKDFPRLGWSF